MTREERKEKIRQIMDEKRMTARWLMENTSLHRNTIGRALRGKNVTADTLIELAKGLGVDPAELI